MTAVDLEHLLFSEGKESSDSHRCNHPLHQAKHCRMSAAGTRIQSQDEASHLKWSKVPENSLYLQPNELWG